MTVDGEQRGRRPIDMVCAAVVRTVEATLIRMGNNTLIRMGNNTLIRMGNNTLIRMGNILTHTQMDRQQ